MKQQTFWKQQKIVTDRERIRFYLAQMMRILKGEA